MEGLDWRLISPRKNKELVALFTLEEITKVVFSCDGNKFPSADGLSMAFFQENLVSSKEIWRGYSRNSCKRDLEQLIG